MIYFQIGFCAALFIAGMVTGNRTASALYERQLEAVKQANAKQWESYHFDLIKKRADHKAQLTASAKALEAMSDENAKTIDDLAAANHKLLNAAGKAVPRCAGNGKAARPAQNRHEPARAGNGQFLEGIGESLIREAARADKVADQLAQCQTFLKQERGIK